MREDAVIKSIFFALVLRSPATVAESRRLGHTIPPAQRSDFKEEVHDWERMMKVGGAEMCKL